MRRSSLSTRLVATVALVQLALAGLLCALLWSRLADLDPSAAPPAWRALFDLAAGSLGLAWGLSLLLLWGVARTRLSHRLRRLLGIMQQAERGDFLVRVPDDGDDEIAALGHAFNRVLATVTDLQARHIEQDQDLAEAHKELALRQQLEEKSQAVAEANTRLKRRVEELTLLTDLTKAVTSSLELDAVLDQISRRVGRMMNVDEVTVMLRKPRGRRLYVRSCYGAPEPEALRKLSFALGEGISGRAAQSGRPLLVRDTRQDPRYLHYKGLRPDDGSFLSMPMKAKGRVVGVLDCFRAQTDAFDDASVTLLSAVAGQAALAIENANLFETQLQLARTDGLTGLLNRRTLDQRLEEELLRARRFANPLAVMMIDVDHFKRFNDQHGHLLGDHVLKQVARTLKRQVRQVDVVARFGGEEFCVVLVRTDLARALEIGEKLRAAVEKKTFARMRSDTRLGITISVGVAALQAQTLHAQALIDDADRALYRAKNSGRNKVVAADSDGGIGEDETDSRRGVGV